MSSYLPLRMPLVFALVARLLSAASAAPPPVATVPAVAPQPDGAHWAKAAVLGPFARLDGQGMPHAATRARIHRSAQGLHIRMVCDEPRMDQLAMSHTGRDAEVWKDDCVEVFVGNPRLKPYVHFTVNPAATRFDEQGRDAAWNVDWQAKTTLGKSGWTVDFSFPWRSVGGEPKPGETWRLNVCRSRRPVAELACWAPTGSGFHVPDRFGFLRFGAAPVPTALSWHLPSPIQGEVRSTWSPVTPAPALTVNGRPAGKGFVIEQDGDVPLWLEARIGDTLIYRSLHVARIVPVRGLVGAIGRLLGQIPAHPTTDAEVAELRTELRALQELAQNAPPELSQRVEGMLRQLRVRSSHLAVRAQLLGSKAPADGITYGVETSLRKLLRHEPFTGQAGGGLTLDAARNEMASGQVVLFAFADPLLMARGELGEFKAKSGVILPATALRLRRVGYVHTCPPVYRVDYTGIWPDPLLAATPFDVKSHSFETLWVDVRVPAGTAPGVYQGAVQVTAKNARPTSVPVAVRVRSFTIPAKSSLSTAFGLSPHWRVEQDRPAYVRNYLEHRISPYSSAPSPKLEKPPLLDWRQALELRVRVRALTAGALSVTVVPETGEPLVLGPRDIVAGKDASFTLDLRQLRQPVREWRVALAGSQQATLTAQLVRADGTATLCADKVARQRVGKSGWIEEWPTWSGNGWDTPEIPAVWDWAEFDTALDTYLPLGLTAHRAPLRPPFGGWAKALQEHLRGTGRLELFYTYLFDEPTPDRYPRLNQVLGDVKRNAPGVKNMMTARHFPPELKYVDIWCPEAYSFDPVAAKAEQERGREVWWYVAFSTRHPYPNVWIDYPAIDCRVWPWMTWKHDLDGMLYWSGTAWNRNDPWRTGETFHDSNGDGSLMYPGDDGQPVDSIRWECLRDGLEDYEVFCLLEAGGHELRAAKKSPDLVQAAERLCAIDDTVVRSFRDYNSDPSALVATRRKMSDALERIVAALGHEPKIQNRPRRRPGVDLSKIPPEPVPDALAGPVLAVLVLRKAQPEPGLALRYAFETPAPFACDLSGKSRHGRVSHAKREAGTLVLTGKGGVRLPSGLELLGAKATIGTISLWARPDFDPTALSGAPAVGYSTLFYIMQADGNGLPDGYDEIGVFLHGRKLVAHCGGQPARFAVVDSPFVKGKWTHVAMTWGEKERRLYVDGKAVAVVKGAFIPAQLDSFAGSLGYHSPHGRWQWQGAVDEFRIYRRALSPAEIQQLGERGASK